MTLTDEDVPETADASRLRRAHDYSLDPEPITPKAMAAMKRGARTVAALLMDQKGMRQWRPGNTPEEQPPAYKEAVVDLADAILYGKTRTNWNTVKDASGNWVHARDRELADKLKLLPRHLEVAGRMSPNDLVWGSVGQIILSKMGRTLKRQKHGNDLEPDAIVSFLQEVANAKKQAVEEGKDTGWPGRARVSGDPITDVHRLFSDDTQASAHRVSSGGARTRRRKSRKRRGRSGRKRVVAKFKRVRRRRRRTARRRR